jgi:hypothetical protein
MSTKKELAAIYYDLHNKKPFAGWNEVKLQEKIDVKSKEIGEDVGVVSPVIPSVEIKTDKDLFPPLPDGLKTGDEVVAEQIQRKEELSAPISELSSVKQIAAGLYARLTDGAYRAKIKQFQNLELTNEELIEKLEDLKGIIREGELKGIVQSVIISLT